MPPLYQFLANPWRRFLFLFLAFTVGALAATLGEGVLHTRHELQQREETLLAGLDSQLARLPAGLSVSGEAFVRDLVEHLGGALGVRQGERLFVVREGAEGPVVIAQVPAEAPRLEQIPKGWREAFEAAAAGGRGAIRVRSPSPALLVFVHKADSEVGLVATSSLRAFEAAQSTATSLGLAVAAAVAALLALIMATVGGRVLRATGRSAEGLALAQEVANLGSWEWDIQSGALGWSDQIYRIFGVPPQHFEATYEAFLRYVHPSDRLKVQEAVQAAVEGRAPYLVEHRVVRDDGSERVVEERGKVTYASDGTPLRMLGVVLDVTERRQIESLLKDERALASALVDTSAALVLILDAEGRVRRANPTFQRITGRRAAQVEGEHFWDIYLSERERAAARETFRSVVEGTGSGRREGRLIGGLGSELLISWHDSVIRDEAGEVAYVASIGMDITEQRATEETLALEQRRLTDAQRVAGMGSWEWDLASESLSVSAGYRLLAGIEPEAELGNDAFLEHVPEDDQRRLMEGLGALMSEGRELSLEYTLCHPRRGAIEVLAHARLIRSEEGEAMQVLGTVVDISAQKQAEAALREQEESLRHAQRIAKLGSWSWDAKEQVGSWSDELYEIFGMRRGEIEPTPRSLVTLACRAGAGELAEAVARSLEGQEIEGLGACVQRREDGTRRFVELQVEVEHDLAGFTERLHGTVLDVTERKQVEEALRASQTELTEAQSLARMASWSWHIESGHVTGGEAVKKIVGMTGDAPLTFGELIGRIHEDDRARVERVAMGAVRACGPFDYEARMVGDDHQERYVRVRGGISVAAAGAAQRYAGVIIDLTSEVKTRRDLMIRNAAVESSINAIAIIDLRGQITYVNRAFEELWRAEDPADVEHRRFCDLWEDAVMGDVVLDQVLEEERWRGEIRALTLDGKAMEIELSSSLVRDAEGLPLCVMGFFVDVTERNRALERTRLSSKVFDAAAEAILITDPTGRVVEVNDAYCAMNGVARDEILGSSYHPYAGEGADRVDIPTLVAQTGSWRGEIEGERRGGERYPLWLSVTSVDDFAGDLSHLVYVASDITTVKRAEEQLRMLAHYDPLTGLPNRALFHDRLGMQVSAAVRHRRSMGVIFLDLDRFKQINDTLGHHAGDQLLVQVAARLKECVRSEDTVCRLAGDEFTIILAELQGPQYAEMVANRIMRAFEAPMLLDGQEVHVSCSLGIALCPTDGEDVDTLLRNADTAMYHAKGRGRSCFQFYDQAMNVAQDERAELEHELAQAIQREELLVYFQPKYDLVRQVPVGAEALVRWQHPERGMISPAQFIPLAEQTGLVVPLGRYILEESCRQAQRWSELGLGDLSVAVNLSVVQLNDPDLISDVQAALADSGLDPQRLELEITETMLMDDLDARVEVLSALRDLGVRISIDDFGTGYSSLSYLKRLPIDALKVDRSFVKDIGDDFDSEAITAAIISMAHQLHLKVVAEGVETPGQLAFLKACECDLAQGFFLSRPVPADRIAEVYRELMTIEARAQA